VLDRRMFSISSLRVCPPDEPSSPWPLAELGGVIPSAGGANETWRARVGVVTPAGDANETWRAKNCDVSISSKTLAGAGRRAPHIARVSSSSRAPLTDCLPTAINRGGGRRTPPPALSALLSWTSCNGNMAAAGKVRALSRVEPWSGLLVAESFMPSPSSMAAPRRASLSLGIVRSC